ncbi:winged helix-turn-helix domain-containing protein [Streptomyces sp. NBC_01012]|uniref:winged helix-turn-helix domain-containing protein n=1 Tax=Streptomyces sp. NBC_01012 TaxID=2903717 RepID=UPI00386FFBF0|nr:helix-turn-helix domain-containing protein [Streptomyces sp. NBC_01012]
MPQRPGSATPPPDPEPSSSAPVELGELGDLGELGALKALAHPRRQRVLEHLTLYGPATSAMLARALGLNTGSTSYHLRELARYGFTEETGSAGGAERTDGTGGQVRRGGGGGTGGTNGAEAAAPRGRERWWRAVPGDRRFPPRSRQSPEARHVMDELNHHAYAADLDLFERLQRGADDGPWADAFPYSRGSIQVTVPELHAFFEEYIALLNRYKRTGSDVPPGARTLLTRFLAFPVPEPAGDGSQEADAS